MQLSGTLILLIIIKSWHLCRSDVNLSILCISQMRGYQKKKKKHQSEKKKTKRTKTTKQKKKNPSLLVLLFC